MIVPSTNVTPLRAAPPTTAARPPLRSLELEQEFLGCLLYRSELCVSAMALLKAEHFAEPLHARMFTIADELMKQGQGVTFPIVLTYLDGSQEIEPGLSLQAYLASLLAGVGTPGMAIHTARAIRDLAVRRAIIAAVSELAEVAYDPPAGVSPSRIAADTIDQLHAIVASSASDGTRHTAGDMAARVIDRTRRIISGELKDDGVPTGFRRLDDLTGGYRAGALWLVGARPGVGKTVFMVTSSVKLARRGTGVLDFSLEVSESQITARILADIAYTPRHTIAFSQIERGQLDESDLWQVDEAQKRLAAMPLVVDCASRLTVAELRARVHAERERMARTDVRLGVVFIDYLKMIQASDRYRGNRVEEIGEITAGLKQIAKDEKVCVVLLVQLLRALDGREDKRPALADLRGSGDLEADADVVAFLHREAYHIEKSPQFRKGDNDAVDRHAQCKFDAELIIGKNRAGAEGVVDLWCDVSASTMASQAPGMM